MDNPILSDVKLWGQTKIALLTICDFIYLLIWLRQVFIAARVIFCWDAQALVVPTQGLHSKRASVVMAGWFSCSQACRIFVSRPRTEWTHVPCIARHFLNHWTTRVKDVIFKGYAGHIYTAFSSLVIYLCFPNVLQSTGESRQL